MDVGTYNHKSECNHLPKEKDRGVVFGQALLLYESFPAPCGGGVLSHTMIFHRRIAR